MKWLVYGLLSIGLACVAGLLHGKLSNNAQGFAITAALLGVNLVMLIGVVRKHR